MSDIDKDIEILKDMKGFFSDCEVCTDDCDEKTCVYLRAIENVLEELERLRLEEKRKDKMIDKMAQKLLNYDFMFIKSKHRIKEVFRNEVLENE